MFLGCVTSLDSYAFYANYATNKNAVVEFQKGQDDFIVIKELLSFRDFTPEEVSGKLVS